MDNVKDFLNEYYDSLQVIGILRFVFDIIIVGLILVLFFILIRQKVKIKNVILVFGALLVLFFIAIFFNLPLLKELVKLCSSWIIGFFILIYHDEIKQAFDGKRGYDNLNSAFNNEKEKEEVINVICTTVEYLSKRRIGALITFERKDSLESLINKAIPINCNITQEILTTIFYPGTSCHDGGVIIQNNKIVCAGAYYPLSDNYDIPTFLGTRHRAAIGISEKYDAVTLIVSEETGNISIAVGGNITLELSIDRVRSLLDGYLSIK